MELIHTTTIKGTWNVKKALVAAFGEILPDVVADKVAAEMHRVDTAGGWHFWTNHNGLVARTQSSTAGLTTKVRLFKQA